MSPLYLVKCKIDDDDVTILMCVQKLTDASLIYHTEPETKTERKRTKNKINTGYAQKKRCRARNRGVSPEGGKGSLGWKGFVKQVGFEPGVKKRRRQTDRQTDTVTH